MLIIILVTSTYMHVQKMFTKINQFDRKFDLNIHSIYKFTAL